MKTLRRVSIAIALAGLCSPAFAQEATPADPATSAPAVPAPGAAAPTAPVSPTQIVDREFPSYDLDKSGDLNASEFSAWVSKLRKPAADGAPQADTQSWSSSLFARADADHNRLVSKTEMTTLLASAKG